MKDLTLKIKAVGYFTLLLVIKTYSIGLLHKTLSKRGETDRTEGGQTAARLWERLFTTGSVSSVAEYPRLRLIRQNSGTLIPDRSEHGLNYKPFKYAYTYTGTGLFITQSGQNRACIL